MATCMRLAALLVYCSAACVGARTMEHGSALPVEQSHRLEGAAPVAGQRRRRLLQDVGLCSGLETSCLAAAGIVSDPPAPTDAMGQVAAELAFIAYPGQVRGRFLRK